jgi:hypothetical protein
LLFIIPPSLCTALDKFSRSNPLCSKIDACASKTSTNVLACSGMRNESGHLNLRTNELVSQNKDLYIPNIRQPIKPSNHQYRKVRALPFTPISFYIVLNLSRRYQAQIYSPSHTCETPNQSPALNTLDQGIINQTDRGPQLPACIYQRQEFLYRNLPSFNVTSASIPRKYQREEKRIERSGDCLIEKEFYSGVSNRELGFEDLVGFLLAIELFLIT